MHQTLSGFCHGSVLTILDWSLSSLGESPDSCRILMTHWHEMTYKRATIMTPFTQISIFKKHDFCTKNILVTDEIVHDRTIRYFSSFRTLIEFLNNFTLRENYRFRNGNHDGCAEIISRSVLSIGRLKFRTRWLLWRSRAIFEYKNGHLQRKFIKWIYNLWNAINKIKHFLKIFKFVFC